LYSTNDLTWGLTMSSSSGHHLLAEAPGPFSAVNLGLL
jgi:hypothetical protein